MCFLTTAAAATTATAALARRNTGPYVLKLGTIVFRIHVARLALLTIFALHVGCPESEVVAQELHDERGVLVALFAQAIKLVNCFIERLLRKAACAFGRIENLVVEDAEVKSKAEAYGMSRSEILGGLVLRRAVGDKSGLRCLFAIVLRLELGEVSVVIAFHLEVEDFRLAGGGGGDEVVVKKGEDRIADIAELLLDLVAILLDALYVVVVAFLLLLLLNGAHDAPGRTASANDVLVRHAEEVALLNTQLLIAYHLGHLIHLLHHLVVPLRLLRKFRPAVGTHAFVRSASQPLPLPLLRFRSTEGVTRKTKPLAVPSRYGREPTGHATPHPSSIVQLWLLHCHALSLRRNPAPVARLPAPIGRTAILKQKVHAHVHMLIAFARLAHLRTLSSLFTFPFAPLSLSARYPI